MSQLPPIHVLAAVPQEALSRYREHLGRDPQLVLTLVTGQEEAVGQLSDPRAHHEVLVLDSGLGDMYGFVKELRQTHAGLLIVLVDEGADFGLPGQADELSVAPFEDNDLLRRIKRLTEERRLQTLRTDIAPAVRTLAKKLTRARSTRAMLQAAVEAICELGYDYAAFYAPDERSPDSLVVRSQAGSAELIAAAPSQQNGEESLVGWVARNGQSRAIGPADALSHPFVQQQRMNRAVCVPVGMALRYGVLLACRAQPEAIAQKQVMMLELIGAHLANALARRDRP
jgi:hypothetical protein